MKIKLLRNYKLSEYSIKLEKVSKSFKITPSGIFKKFSMRKQSKKFYALTDISFEVQKGEILAIIGLNGSGKTTLLRIMAGIYQPDSGSVELEGKLAPLLHIGSGFQGELTAKDNIMMSGRLLGLTKSEINKKIKNIIEYAELTKFSNLKLKHYSTGMKMRLAFSTILQIDPDIILLDEAMAVGDKVFQEKSFDSFKSFKNKGKTIVFTTHNLGQVLDFCDRAMIIHEGKITSIGNPQDVLKKYREITNGKK